MILIYDNGQEYSDHGLYFIDPGGFDPEKVGQILSIAKKHDEGKVIGNASSISWVDNLNSVTMWDLLDCPMYFEAEREDHLLDEGINTLLCDLIGVAGMAELCRRWRSKPEKLPHPKWLKVVDQLEEWISLKNGLKRQMSKAKPKRAQRRK